MDRHIVLLGDSIFDNKSYLQKGEKSVKQHIQAWRDDLNVTKLAEDGACASHVKDQIWDIPETATHLALSVGGNDVLTHMCLLEKKVSTLGEGLLALAQAHSHFLYAYEDVMRNLKESGYPCVVCTIYNPKFPEPEVQSACEIALAVYNDTIRRMAANYKFRVIELRDICTEEEDFVRQIEPSAVGGAKIAKAVATSCLWEDYDKSPKGKEVKRKIKGSSVAGN